MSDLAKLPGEQKPPKTPAAPESPETISEKASEKISENTPTLEKLREKLHMPKKPDEAKEPVEEDKKADKPKIGSLDELIKIAGLGPEEAAAEESRLIGSWEEAPAKADEPPAPAKSRLPEIKKPAWLEEMEAAEAAGQQQETKPGRRFSPREWFKGLGNKLGKSALPRKSRREKPEAKPISQPINKPITKPDTKTDFKALIEAESKPEIKPEAKPDIKSDIKSDNKPEEDLHNDQKPEQKPTVRGEGRGRSLVAGRSRRRLGLGAAGLCLLGLALWLGLGLLGDKPALMYDLCYPSGYSRDPYCRDEQTPVQSDDLPKGDLEGAKLRLAAAPAGNGIQLLDGDGALLYQLACQEEFSTLRGELARSYAGAEEAVWICAEAWQKSRYNGYLEGGLLGSRLMLVNPADGEQLFSGTAGPGELYLTSRGEDCYFYVPGEPEQHRWLIFGKIEAVPARIICRSITHWEEADTVYSFGYADRPFALCEAAPETPEPAKQPETTGPVGVGAADSQNSPENPDNADNAAEPQHADKEQVPVERICFNIGPEGITVALKRYELTDSEKERWDFVTKETITVPYLETVEEEPQQ